MDYIKIRLSADLDQLNAELKKTMDNVFGAANPMFSRLSQKWTPQMDIYETVQELFVVAAVAGVDKNTLEIEINERAVRISGGRSPFSSAAGKKFCLAEIQYGQFNRILFLPSLIDTDKVSASLSSGMLRITMTKRTPPQPKKIPITTDTTDA